MSMVFLSFGVGVLLWTLTEYLLHRYLGHERRGKGSFSREHLRHHTEVNYFARAHEKIIHAVIVFLTITVLGALLFQFVFSLSLASGFVVGWYTYEAIHLSIHERDAQTQYGRFVRRHHFYHHFENPWVNHGVTSPIWDFVFRTFVPSHRIRVPKKHQHAIIWMRNHIPKWTEDVFLFERKKEESSKS
jgi:sterol desaturase/sphingolipid hydroxylase (fatty acid hydroxylase superfamily)